MIVANIINEFRSLNSRCPIQNWDKQISHYCVNHCWAMVKNGFYHAEPHYLNDWEEIIAVCSQREIWEDTVRYLIFATIGNSIIHREILLNSSEIGYGIIVCEGNVYFTIRGRR